MSKLQNVYDLNLTKNFATKENALVAVEKILNKLPISENEYRVFVEVQNGRYIPVTYLRTDEATRYAFTLASRGFYVFN